DTMLQVLGRSTWSLRAPVTTAASAEPWTTTGAPSSLSGIRSIQRSPAMAVADVDVALLSAAEESEYRRLTSPDGNWKALPGSVRRRLRVRIFVVLVLWAAVLGLALAVVLYADSVTPGNGDDALAAVLLVIAVFGGTGWLIVDLLTA